MSPLPMKRQTPPVSPVQPQPRWMRIATFLAHPIDVLKKEMRTHHAVEALMGFDDRMLSDLGVTRSEIGQVVRHGSANDNRSPTPTPQDQAQPATQKNAPATAGSPARRCSSTGFMPGIRMA